MKATILEGDVFGRLKDIAPGSVDVVVTSPPYWQLRSYLAKDHPLKHLELGSEPTIDEYVEKMVRVFRLVRECMANHGTCWINIAPSYASAIIESDEYVLRQDLTPEERCHVLTELAKHFANKSRMPQVPQGS